ncbi:uncharacterized protein LOC119689305 [Teleopsis dalmanni]|uniref:uncharacterized protein LOC119689305 n=1 Tax=Teleopsis dalmanni TaxID=139649 RepID=UPI0018CE58F5|nr:uncharacterized protein LOC119689305 [Teleopsis dalmanni]
MCLNVMDFFKNFYEILTKDIKEPERNWCDFILEDEPFTFLAFTLVITITLSTIYSLYIKYKKSKLQRITVEIALQTSADENIGENIGENVGDRNIVLNGNRGTLEADTVRTNQTRANSIINQVFDPSPIASVSLNSNVLNYTDRVNASDHDANLSGSSAVQGVSTVDGIQSNANKSSGYKFYFNAITLMLML